MTPSRSIFLQAAAADPPPRSREVQERIEEAEKAAKRLDLARARELWARINELEPSTMAVCQLGVFDLRLGRLEEAAAELSTCVAQMPAPTNDIERRRHEVRRADLAPVRQRVAELHVSAPPGTARLLVDGREVSAGGPVFVAPGQHDVTATGKQGQVARALVQVTAGQSRRVALAFVAPKAAGAPARARNPWTIGGAVSERAAHGAGATAAPSRTPGASVAHRCDARMQGSRFECVGPGRRPLRSQGCKPLAVVARQGRDPCGAALTARVTSIEDARLVSGVVERLIRSLSRSARRSTARGDRGDGAPGRSATHARGDRRRRGSAARRPRYGRGPRI
ncbi:hypothetical protein WME76_39105 [Sorangium sp. So ce119]|uniref:hypothetical protein n=1 Tax=Sorangium sp. So ce119 TaxID=3133279 RepID=UPI003F5FF17C